MARMAAIPEVVNDFNIYNTGEKMVGVSGEVSMAEFENMTETISGAGILGEYAVPVAGRYSSVEQEIPFRVIDEDYFSLISPDDPVALTLRGAIQQTIKSTGAVNYIGMRVVFRGRCKKISLGTVKQGGPMEGSITLEVTYALVEMDGKKRFEIDKINGVCKVNGKDLLAKIHRLT